MLLYSYIVGFHATDYLVSKYLYNVQLPNQTQFTVDANLA